jgi:hypothetical protein
MTFVGNRKVGWGVVRQSEGQKIFDNTIPVSVTVETVIIRI